MHLKSLAPVCVTGASSGIGEATARELAWGDSCSGRAAIPSAAIFLPVAFFLSVFSPTVTKPNGLIHLAYVGAVTLTIGLFTRGVGLL
jgi:hypothetical protein